jgi:NitT/TauT family transport system substrate-binding protein
MHGRNRRLSVMSTLGGAVLVAVLVVAVSATTGTARSTACAKTDDVSFLQVVSPDFVPIDVMQQNGLSAKYCLNVQRKIIASPPAILQAVVAGDSNIGYNNVGAIANALAQGIDIKILYALEMAKDNNNGIFVPTNSSIRTLKDLEGKTIGLLGLNGNAHAGIIQRLGRAGVDVKKVKFTVFPFPQMVDGIVSGQIDAGQLAEPFLSQGADKLRMLFPTYSVFGKKVPTTYLVANGKWAAENPDLVQRFQQAYGKALIATDQNPEIIRDLVAKQDPSQTRDILARQVLPALTVDLGIPGMRNQLKRMVKLGMVPKEPDYYGNIFIRPKATSGDDLLNGWDRAETLSGKTGNDTILGFEGNDTLDGGAGNDIIDAGLGSDEVSGGAGNDVISAIDGQKDTINCGPGKDKVYSDAKDVLSGCESVSHKVPTNLLLGLGVIIPQK